MIAKGTIVKVTAEHPDGIEKVKTKGEIGVVSKIEVFEERNEVDYTVSTMHSDYLYSEEQITKATAVEVRNELKRIIENAPSRSRFSD